MRHDVFSPAENDAIVDDCERLVIDLVRDRHGHRMKAGSYVFDPDLVRFVIIKWEGDSDVVHGIEPLAHLSPALDAWANDERFLDPDARTSSPRKHRCCSRRSSTSSVHTTAA